MDAAQARGEELRTGGKALLMKVDKDYQLFVLPADRKIDSSRIRRKQQARKLRFATPDELLELTGLVPGSVPPFGKPILPFDLFIDDAVCDNERIAFNAGSLTDSIVLAIGDYFQVARPTRVFSFTVKP